MRIDISLPLLVLNLCICFMWVEGAWGADYIKHVKDTIIKLVSDFTI